MNTCLTGLQGVGNDKHADRAARQLEEAETGMFNAKNTYLISVSVANKVKDQFYSVNVPEIEDVRSFSTS